MMRNESKTLSDKLIWAFSVGHMPNDLIASIWFNYYAFYLTNIIKIGFFYAGMAIFLGQLADVFGTIIAGRLSDKHKKIHIYIPGVCLVLLSSLSIYFPIRISENPFYLFVYYSFLGILLNLGYSFVMNSHYALISNLTNDIKTRALLIERKVAFSFVSQMLTLIISYYIFSSIITDSQNQYFLLAI